MAEPLTRADVEEIAQLARLKLEDSEIESLRDELSTILAHIDALSEVDVDDVEPMTHAVPLQLRLRDDVVEESLSIDDVMADAPDHHDDCFRVPHIIKSSNAGSGAGKSVRARPNAARPNAGGKSS